MKTCVILTVFLMAGLSLGDIQKRILDGRPCTADESPQFVFLETRGVNNGKNMISRCSGSVIGTKGNWVVTAKHCDVYGKPFTIKGVSGAVEDTSNTKFPHTSADLMLIKMNIQKTPIELADTTECTNINNQINSNGVQMVLVARDTNERNTNKVDKVLCGDVNVERCQQQTGNGPCFTGINFKFLECWTCVGDSGGGYIYKSVNNYKLYGVFWGGPDGLTRQINNAVIVCDNNIRTWILNIMNQNP